MPIIKSRDEMCGNCFKAIKRYNFKMNGKS